jgi:hypothetical protein
MVEFGSGLYTESREYSFSRQDSEVADKRDKSIELWNRLTHPNRDRSSSIRLGTYQQVGMRHRPPRLS